MVRLCNTVKVLSLDAMDTIIRLKESPTGVYAHFAYSKFGIVMNQPILKSAFKNAFRCMELKEPCYSYNNKGPKHWWRNVVKLTFQKYSDKLNDEIIDKLSQELFSYYASPEPWVLTENSDLNEAIAQFREKHGVKIAVVSNFDSRLRGILKSFNFPHVDEWFLSGEIGVEKPNPEIFRRMAEHFDVVDYGQIIHIGDNFERDYAAPKALGIKSLLYAPSEYSKLIEREIPQDDIVNSISHFLRFVE